MKQSGNEDKLLNSAVQGDDKAIEALLEMYKGLVKHRVRSYYLVGGETEDLIQEGMIGLFKAIRDYDPKKGKFATFAAICIDRQINSAVKQSLREKHRPLNFYVSLNYSDDALMDTLAGPESQNPQSVIEAREEYRRIQQIIEKGFSELERQVLSRFLGGQSYHEIAASLSVNVKSVDNAIQRIRRKLEKHIKDDSK